MFDSRINQKFVSNDSSPLQASTQAASRNLLGDTWAAPKKANVSTADQIVHNFEDNVAQTLGSHTAFEMKAKPEPQAPKADQTGGGKYLDFAMGSLYGSVHDKHIADLTDKKFAQMAA